MEYSSNPRAPYKMRTGGTKSFRTGARSIPTTARHQYMIFVEGIPLDWRWEDLKDFAKKITYRVRADILDTVLGGSVRVGLLKVNGRDDAERMYSYLENRSIKGRRLRVHSFDTSDSRMASERVACNCARLQHEDDGGVPDDITCPFETTAHLTEFFACPDAAKTVPNGSMYSYAVEVNAASPVLGIQGDFANAHDPTDWSGVYFNSFEPGVFEPMSPIRSFIPPDWSGAPINTVNGYYETETHGIHISQLAFAVKEQDLRALLLQAGSLFSLTINRNADGKCRGSAIATFNRCSQARRAVELFDGYQYMDRKLRVKLDREAIASFCQAVTYEAEVGMSNEVMEQPIIVDGSRSRLVKSAGSSTPG